MENWENLADLESEAEHAATVEEQKNNNQSDDEETERCAEKADQNTRRAAEAAPSEKKPIVRTTKQKQPTRPTGTREQSRRLADQLRTSLNHIRK